MQLKPTSQCMALQSASSAKSYVFSDRLLDNPASISLLSATRKVLGSSLLGLALLMSGASMAQDNDPLSQYADDPATTSKVKAALVGDQMLSALDIKVQSDDLGAVHLSGTAGSPAEVSHATTVARGVSGVVSVQNDIIVDGKGTASERKNGARLE